jgi:hypothetical protein
VARRPVDRISHAAARPQANRVSPDLDRIVAEWIVADLKWIVADQTVVDQRVAALALPVMAAVDCHSISVPISPAVARLPDLVANLADALPADPALIEIAADPTVRASKAAAASSIATFAPEDLMVAAQPLPNVARAQVTATACGMAHAIAMTVIECQHAMPASGSTRWNASWTVCCKKFTICETGSDNAG